MSNSYWSPRILPQSSDRDGLNRRMAKLHLSKEQRNAIRLDSGALDRYGIPYSWTQLFERHGLGSRYAGIRGVRESPNEPFGGYYPQQAEFEEMLDKHDFSESIEELIRGDIEALGSRGYRVNLFELFQEYLDIESNGAELRRPQVS